METCLESKLVTLCPSVKDPKTAYYRTVGKILNAFRGDEHVKEQVEQVRNGQKSKTELPVVVFGGKFERRSNSALQDHSGLIILDFDVETKYESEKIYETLSNDKYVYSYFRSTSGYGYKALVKIPYVKNDAEFKSYFNAIKDYFKNVDVACKDISRACFYTYDPDLVINEDSEVWKEKKETEVNNLSGVKIPANKKTDYNTANRVVNVIRYAVEGERHTKILKASLLMGGFVASGKVEYSEAERLLQQEANAVDPEDYKTNERAIYDGLSRGMEEPINTEEELKKEEKHSQLGKIYYTATDASDKIYDKYRKGIGKGWTVGYPSVDQIYKIFPGYFTVIYGSSFSGKSLVWFDYLKNLSFRYGLKHCIFSPETGGYDDVFIKLIEMVAEKDFYDFYNNQMSEQELEEAKKFVDKNFIVIDPGEHDLDVDTCIEYLQIIENVYNVKVNTLTIDPWNDLDHPMHEDFYREDKYLEKAIKKIRLAAFYNHWHICIITHARDQKLSHDKDSGVSYYPPATFREIAGGQTWSRKGFQMASVWRPPKGLTEADGMEFCGDGSETVWIQQKYKPDWAGESGIAKLKLDAKRHRFYEDEDFEVRYADLRPVNEETDSKEAEDDAPF